MLITSPPNKPIVTLEIENALYNSEIEIEAVTLTIEKARELAGALLSVDRSD